MCVLLTLSGCATLFAGGPDRIPVATNPPGATVFVDNVPVGQTPLWIALDRSHGGGVIRLELPGFAPVTLVREKGINGWFWVNICLLSIVGVVVDLVTGDVKAYDDTPIAIGMTPLAGGYPEPQPGYAPQPGYPAQPGYAPQPGYPPAQPNYAPPPPGYPAQPAPYPPAAPPAQPRH